jgi:2,3,4,5-tetrahydropyridine-2,6-dicarboxylate N-succinyltransferase
MSDLAGIVRDLESGRRRAAYPDEAVLGGWRVDESVKSEILDLFRDRTARTWDVGGVFAFRDRAAVPPRVLPWAAAAGVVRGADGWAAGVVRRADAEAGGHGGVDDEDPGIADTWRIVPGGTVVRAGVWLGRSVTIMPPSYVNVGAWIGDETMIDSHGLVGSCAQVGSRVHLSAGVQVGGVLEPANARPVIVEDGAFVGGGCGLYEGVLVGRSAVLGAGVILTGTSRLYDLVHERVLTGTREQPLAVPEGAVIIPGTRALASTFATTHGLAAAVALVVKYRDAATTARVALEDVLR